LVSGAGLELNKAMRIVIVGGSDAGISAALRAREVNPDAEISVFLADEFPNYSICGLPFFLSGETPDWRTLAHRTQFEGIEIHRSCPVKHIDLRRKTVTQALDGILESIPYDQLVIGTGAVPVRPQIEGTTLPGVHELHTMQDSFNVKKHLEQNAAKSAIVIGAGYIGVEMADALAHHGMDVTLVGRSRLVFPSVDPEFGALIEGQLRCHGVDVVNATAVARIEAAGSGLVVTARDGWRKRADLILVVVGVRPDSDLAREAGIPLGNRGAIKVNSRMETEVPGVYAAGDCVETWHHLLQRYTYLPLGTTSHKQGRTAGENAAGGDREFAGSVGTQVVKIFDIAVARTGLRQNDATEAGFNAATTAATFWDHKAYYPGAEEMRFRVTGDRISGRLLGAQIVGHWKSEVSKRIDVFATALFHGMTVDGLNDLDLSYTPPLSSPWDPVQMSAQAWLREAKLEGKTLMQKERVLILCTGNSARSQMAEGLLRHDFGDRFEVSSAGTKPSHVRPEAIAVMRELDIDLTSHRSKHVSEFEGQPFEYVITVCDNANESCPVFPASVKRIHWSFEDPAAVVGSEPERLVAFRRIRDQIRTKFQEFGA
jgi:thioredoxin type arsenate reductase